MIGISVYLNDVNIEYLDYARKNGVREIFTSFKMIEENYSILYSKAIKLVEYCNKHKLILIADVDEKSAMRFGLDSIANFSSLGVMHIRIDGGITNNEIAKLSKNFKVYLNASDISQAQLKELVSCGLEVKNCIAMHNFYPLEHTGLEENYFKQINQIISSFGIEVAAFIPGNRKLRGPVFNGLPTLESNRGERPYVAYLRMKEKGISKIFIGDNQISIGELRLINNGSCIELRVDFISEEIKSTLINIEHDIRPDYNSSVVRITDRKVIEGEPIGYTYNLVKGAITIENKYAIERYQGEMQIVKANILSSRSKTVIGYVRQSDIDLLDLITPAYKIILRDGNDK